MKKEAEAKKCSPKNKTQASHENSLAEKNWRYRWGLNLCQKGLLRDIVACLLFFFPIFWLKPPALKFFSTRLLVLHLQAPRRTDVFYLLRTLRKLLRKSRQCLYLLGKLFGRVAFFPVVRLGDGFLRSCCKRRLSLGKRFGILRRRHLIQPLFPNFQLFMQRLFEIWVLSLSLQNLIDSGYCLLP